MQQNFDQVIEILKKEGLSDEQIGKFVASLNNALSQQLYVAIAEQLSEEDMQRLNLIAEEQDRQNQMRQIFAQKTGKSLQDISDSFIQSYTQEFIEGYHSQQITT